MQIFYKCYCMPIEASIDVPYRQPNEDVIDWMERIQLAIGNDHHNRSPMCFSTTMEYAKIPAPVNAPYLGGKPVTN